MVSHRGAIRHLAVNVLRHPAGGWQIRQADGGVGLRCHAVPTALLLEAAEIFAEGADVAETARQAA
jgi:hypothetical protein